ncbi:MAG: glycerol-3-phosphate 1-O-acyltransferase PlsY [Nitrospira sp. SB0662_bin_26]|nr:glycerol-3-phosphate 1-O-acyltransferase PlsY [Nitrospira sp. SB0662_bin_26]
MARIASAPAMSPEILGTLSCLGAYLLGSIPFGLVFSRLFGAPDPRQAGSRNIGFTNVLRVCGQKVGILTLAGDLGKGWLVGWFDSLGLIPHLWTLLAVLSVVLGHLFPVFLKFHGGKGVATGLGGLLGIHFPIGLTLVGIWAVTVGIWRYSSGGAIMAFATLPLISWFMTFDLQFLIFSLVLSIFVIGKHKGNIVRLLNGTEPSIDRS